LSGADDEVDVRGFLKDQVLIFLGHAADDADDFGGAIAFAEFEASEGAVDFVFGVFTDAAGIEDDCVGLFGVVGELVAVAAQGGDYQFAVQHIHLAADGFDVEEPVVGLWLWVWG
jgi:hypothetical protein